MWFIVVVGASKWLSSLIVGGSWVIVGDSLSDVLTRFSDSPHEGFR